MRPACRYIYGFLVCPKREFRELRLESELLRDLLAEYQRQGTCFPPSGKLTSSRVSIKGAFLGIVGLLVRLQLLEDDHPPGETPDEIQFQRWGDSD